MKFLTVQLPSTATSTLLRSDFLLSVSVLNLHLRETGWEGVD